MKFKQIAVATDHENGEALYALDEDGQLWERTGRWVAPLRGLSGKVERAGYSVNWWQKVDSLTSDPGLGLHGDVPTENQV